VIAPRAAKRAGRPAGADDRDSPAAVRSGAQHRERVVADDDSLRPAAVRERLVEGPFLGGEVDAGEQELPDGHRQLDRPQARGVQRVAEQPLEHGEGPVEADVVRRGERPAREPEHPAVGADEGEVGLRVAPVDREDDFTVHAGVSSATRVSASSSTNAT
jgi:hypothetical protein